MAPLIMLPTSCFFLAHLSSFNKVKVMVIQCAAVFFRLGEITLHDFKGAFDRPGAYRFHFKALDPEFGTVKEEVRELF